MTMPSDLFFTRQFNGSVNERSGEYDVWGDGTPVEARAKDRHYWEFGRMITDYQCMWGGFERLSVAGLPAYRAPDNLQTIVGAGLACEVDRYTGWEMKASKCQDIQSYYDKVSRDTDGQFKVEMQCGNIIDGLMQTKQRFNVYDMDLMCSLSSHRKNRELRQRPLSRLEKRFSVRKSTRTYFPNVKLIQGLVNAISFSAENGPVAVYLNFAMRPLGEDDFDLMRKFVAWCFKQEFEVLEAHNTRYQGNSAMAGVQLLLNVAGNKADTIRKQAEQVVSGSDLKALIGSMGITQYQFADYYLCSSSNIYAKVRTKKLDACSRKDIMSAVERWIKVNRYE